MAQACRIRFSVRLHLLDQLRYWRSFSCVLPVVDPIQQNAGTDFRFADLPYSGPRELPYTAAEQHYANR